MADPLSPDAAKALRYFRDRHHNKGVPVDCVARACDWYRSNELDPTAFSQSKLRLNTRRAQVALDELATRCLISGRPAARGYLWSLA